MPKNVKVKRRKDAPWVPPIKVNRPLAKAKAAARSERIAAIIQRTYASRRELDAVIATGRLPR